MQIKCGNSGISSVIIANVPLFIDQLKTLVILDWLLDQGGEAGNDSSKSRAVSQVIKEAISTFLGLWHFICVCFFDNATRQ